MPSLRAARRFAFALSVSGVLTACAGDGYYLQSVAGHLDLVGGRENIAGLIADEATPAELRDRLALVEEAVDYAAAELALPDNGSYRDYVDVGGPFVAWNVVATPPLSMAPVEWCFVVVGCISYRGYFDRDEAIAYGQNLYDEGYDVSVTGTRAYSTLGWFRDPVPSTIIFDADYDLVGTIFHELAHQRVYVAGDATFNESYAVAVERAAVEQWLADYGDAALAREYRIAIARQEQFLEMLLETRADLVVLYASGLSEPEMLAAKAARFDELRGDYAGLKRGWGGYSGYDGWFASEINNARLALVATYNSGVGAFTALFEANGGDWAAFHHAVELLAALPKAERDTVLFGAGL